MKKIKQVFKFKPFSKRQRKVLNWWCCDSLVKDYDGIIADGAIRSGKTLCMSLSYVMWAMESFHGQNFGMCGKTIGSFRRNVLFWLKLTLKSRGYQIIEHRADNLVTITKGNKENYFYIFGGKDERSQDLIQGITLGGCFFDEVALMPESFVNQATGRCSVEGSKYWFNCNPDGPYHWFKVKWIEKRKEKNLLYLHFSMDDNLSLSEKIKERYRNMYSGVFYRRYILGLWEMAEGIIYDMFDKNVNMANTTDLANHYFDKTGHVFWTSERYVSCDYGTQNPTAFQLWNMAIDKKWYCRREYHYSGREKGKQKTDMEFSEDLTQWLDGEKIRTVILDPSAASFKAQLQKDGYTVINADNDVLDGIRYMSSLLMQGKIIYNASCINTEKEFGSYIWDVKAAERGEDKPVKEHDHCLTGDTIVDTLTGQIPIRDLVGKQDKVFCYDERKKRKTISKFYNVRKTQTDAEVYKIILEDGNEIKLTGEHLVYTERGWVKTKNLKRTDKILNTS